MKNKVIVIGADSFGRGDEKLGSILLSNFLRILGEREREDLPEAIFFSNYGVRLVCEGSNKIDHLRVLQEKGVILLTCRTCLEYLGLMDRVVVGKVSSMAEFIELVSKYDVVSI
ncbi:MAG: DsrE family protein [Acidobacteriota bacterium]